MWYGKEYDDDTVVNNKTIEKNENKFILNGNIIKPLVKYNNQPKYKIDFKDLGQNIQLSDNLNVYSDTFAYKKIYGNNI